MLTTVCLSNFNQDYKMLADNLKVKKIAIYGAGGFGREVHMLIEQINQENKRWEFIGYFDDEQPKGVNINGYPVCGGLTELNNFVKPLAVVIAMGDPKVKRKMILGLKNQRITFPILKHPDVKIGDLTYNTIGEGTIITAGCIVTVNAKIGKHVILNLYCTVGHDSVLGDYSSCMPSVNISGEVVIGEGVYVGTGAQIINKRMIGKDTIVGAGATVVNDLPAKCTAVGSPARVIKREYDD